jgi:hypothetical protein
MTGSDIEAIVPWQIAAVRVRSPMLSWNENAFLGRQSSGPVAQLVEHRTFNAVVAGSSPARLTKNLKSLQWIRLFCPASVLPRSPTPKPGRELRGIAQADAKSAIKGSTSLRSAKASWLQIIILLL